MDFKSHTLSQKLAATMLLGVTMTAPIGPGASVMAAPTQSASGSDSALITIKKHTSDKDDKKKDDKKKAKRKTTDKKDSDKDDDKSKKDTSKAEDKDTDAKSDGTESTSEEQESADSTTPTTFSGDEAIAFAKTDSEIQVKVSMDDNADYAGKLHNGNEATRISQTGDWVEIQSGDVHGYVHAGDLVSDDLAFASANSTSTVSLKAGTGALRVREYGGTDARILGMLYEVNGDTATVNATAANADGWTAVTTASGINGYVSNEFIDVNTTYTYGETKDAEAARLQAEAEAQAQAQAAAEAAAKAAQEAEAAKAAQAQAAAQQAQQQQQTQETASATGQGLVDYARQFLGNPYKWGGSDPVHGADCSGFVMAVYGKYGVSLPHSSQALRSVGKGVDVSNIALGDIVCYSGHVGIYAGNGQIINASNPKSGIKYTPLHYKNILAVRRIF